MNDLFLNRIFSKHRVVYVGPMKTDMSVKCQLKILFHVRRRLGNKSVGIRWGVECQADDSECRCMSTKINFGLNVRA